VIVSSLGFSTLCLYNEPAVECLCCSKRSSPSLQPVEGVVLDAALSSAVVSGIVAARYAIRSVTVLFTNWLWFAEGREGGLWSLSSDSRHPEAGPTRSGHQKWVCTATS